MKKSIFVDIISFFFILLFMYTGVSKLVDIHSFKEEMISSPFLGPLAGFITWGLPIGEVLLAITLVIPRTRLKALYSSLIIMSIFTVYVVVILFEDNQLSCSCGGIIENLTPKQHVLFNIACVILSLLAIAAERCQKPTRQFKWITGTFSVGLLLVLGWTLFTAFSTPAVEKTGMEGRLMPSIDLLLPDSTTHFNTSDISKGQSFIVIGFEPYCTHCQAETRLILKNIQQFKHTRIFYITPWPLWQMKEFYNVFHLAKYPNITIGKDLKNSFLPYFKAPGVPYTAVFDAKKRLKVVLGRFTIENLREEGGSGPSRPA